MKVWVVVPVKNFEAAKSRLSSVLDGVERRRLANEMLEHLLGVLAATPEVTGVTLLTDSVAVAKIAADHGVLSLSDPPGAETLGERVDFALGEIARKDVTAAIVLMSDLPELRVSDVQMLAEELGRFDVVVVRDTRGEHTNALGLHLATRVPTSFGREDSFRRHCRSAERAGLSVGVRESATLAFDVDTPEDYARLVRSRLKRAGAAV